MFRDPVYLAWLIPALALAAGAFAWGAARRRGVTAAMGEGPTIARLVPPETLRRRRLKSALELGALCLLFIALAGPQWGVELVSTSATTRQVMIAVDTSLSMLTEDVKPSRLERAKLELSLLLEALRGERVGVIAFAGEAAVVCPMTNDIDAAKQLLREIEPGMIPVPGTAIGKAIRLAASSLSRYPGAKTLVVLSDGEDHKTDPAGAAEEAAAAGIRIYSIGIGTAEGEPIPLKDASGALNGYKKDKKGNTVVSKLNDATLTMIASKTVGAYFRASPSQNEAAEIAERVQKTEKTPGVGGTANAYKNRFMIPLALAFVLLLIEFLIPERGGAVPPVLKARLLGRKAERPAAAAAALLLVLLVVPGIASAATTEGSLRRGNRLYGRDQYVPALEAYSAAGQKSPSDPRPVFNAGDALFRLEELDKAAEAFETLSKSPKNPAPLRAAAAYNLGNVHMKQNNFDQAISDYRQAVRLNPGDQDAVNNLAVALYFKKHPPPPKDKSKDKNESKKPPPEEKKDKGGGEKPQGDKGQKPPPQPKTRPQDQISREDAERIMRAVADKEKSSGSPQKQFQKAPSKKPEVEEDW